MANQATSGMLEIARMVRARNAVWEKRHRLTVEPTRVNSMAAGRSRRTSPEATMVRQSAAAGQHLLITAVSSGTAAESRNFGIGVITTRQWTTRGWHRIVGAARSMGGLENWWHRGFKTLAETDTMAKSRDVGSRWTGAEPINDAAGSLEQDGDLQSHAA